MNTICKMIFSLSLIPLYAHSSTCENSYNMGYKGFTFPIITDSRNTPEKACFSGRNVTSWITSSDGAKLTSVIKLDDEEFFYVTTYNEQNGNSVLYGVYENSKGEPNKVKLLFNNPKEFEPKQTLENMRLNSYDKENGIVYFSTTAWATSDAIHAFSVPIQKSKMTSHPIKEKFITDGNFIALANSEKCTSCIVVEKISHDEKGAYFPKFLVNNNGENFCQISTKDAAWDLAPECLSKGDEERPR